MTSWKKTIFLGLIFLSAAAGWFLDKTLTQKRELMKIAEVSIFDLKESDINELRLYNPSGSYHIERKKSGWQIIEPRNIEAETTQVELFLSNLVAARRSNPVKTKDLAQYGLDFPDLKITLEKNSGETYTLLVGSESTSMNKYFACIKGKKEVFTIPGHIKRFLALDLFRLRKKSIFHVNKEKIKSISITQKNDILELTKEKNGSWLMTSPIKDWTQKNTVTNLLFNIQTLQATSFVDDDLSTPGFYGFSPTWLQLDIIENIRISLDIGKEDKETKRGYFARIQGQDEIFTLPERFIKTLTAPPSDFRSKKVFRTQKKDIEEIKIIVGQSFVSLQKGKEGTWKFQSRQDIRVSRARIAKLLSDISNLRIGQFEEGRIRSLENYGLKNPRLRIIVYPENHKNKEIVSFGNKARDKDTCYARASKRPYIFGVDWTLVGDFFLDMNDLRDRRLFNLSSKKIHKIQMEFDGKTLFLERVDVNHWIGKSKKIDKLEIPTFKIFGILSVIAKLEFSNEVKQEKIKIAEEALTSPEFKIILYGHDNEKCGEIKAAMLKSPRAFISTDNDNLYNLESKELLVIIKAVRKLFEKN
jgi:uncharacterized protein DUF4340